MNPSCKHCNKTEDNLRLFTTCNRAQKIWSYFQKTYHKLSKQQYTPRQHILTLSSNDTNPKNKKLILTLTQIIIYELSLSRNKLKFEGIHLTWQTIINKIITQLHIILKAHYKLHKLNDTLNQFEQHFCINQAIAKLQNNKLHILLT